MQMQSFAMSSEKLFFPQKNWMNLFRLEHIDPSAFVLLFLIGSNCQYDQFDTNLNKQKWPAHNSVRYMAGKVLL